MFSRMVLCVCLAVAGVWAGKGHEQKIPAAVKAAFQKAYPGAKDVEWKQEGDSFEVEFETGKADEEMTAVYDAAGTLLETETEITAEELPAAILNSVTAAYEGLKIREIDKVDKNGAVTYEIELARKVEVVVDANGTVLKEEDENAAGDDGEDDDDEDED